MPDFTFEPLAHEYRLDGCLLPSTTQILKSVGFIDGTWFNESARERGRAVHSACQFAAEGDLDWDTLHPTLRGYVEAYQKFLSDTKFQPRICEVPIYHPNFFYATTPDQIGTLKDLDADVELKTGTMQKWTALQTAFQTMAKWPNDFYNKVRLGVELRANGTYRIDWHEDPNDFNVAMGALACHGWKAKKA